MMGEPVIQTENLTKKYGYKTAVDNLNLEIDKGEIFGLIGPNGSGKTTTVLMLLGFTEPTHGKCRVLGLDPLTNPREVKRRTGYIPERVGFYEELTSGENLYYVAKLNDIPKDEVEDQIVDVLENVGLEGEERTKVEEFSQGMRQRLAIASVLIKEPEIVFLDEPTTGLDPEGAEEILKIIEEMKAEKEMTVLCSSHLLHHLRRISDRVGMMIDGSMVAEQKISELEDEVSSLIVAEVSEITEDLLDEIGSIEEVESVDTKDGEITVKGKGDLRGKIAETIVNTGSTLLGLERKKVELSDFYERYSKEREKRGGSS
ncbi:hypothetical protein AKJ40_03680 [candidate division MSBL1 archaeon SCGC-AAA259M10]|uniref:ABC transporter domain-containing protein n=1 Tax=candidate division MSBL1 archaeon SCGC-AAA259M10 TaxID=1698270 RepID=A0A133UYH6_9EURY|nr:hypothetical protein AKJ40_03680 [candidate division MSBL1 archaeon SCGC-AAA259M10]